jgi:hypothetical protein
MDYGDYYFLYFHFTFLFLGYYNFVLFLVTENGKLKKDA